MNPKYVNRAHLHSTHAQLTDLPNVGRAVAEDLRRLGINHPTQLIGVCPYTLYEQLNQISGARHDPCMLDTFISITRFMDGEPAQAWWHYTAERKLRDSEKNALKDA